MEDKKFKQILEFARMLGCEVSINEDKKKGIIITEKNRMDFVWVDAFEE